MTPIDLTRPALVAKTTIEDAVSSPTWSPSSRHLLSGAWYRARERALYRLRRAGRAPR